MASKYTTNYNLCQWEASDKVLRTEFNADNAKIDAAIAAVDSRVDGLSSTVSDKASTSALNSLKTTVNGKASQSALDSLTTTVNGLKTSKADKSALDSLSQTVSQHTTALAGKGNCQLYVTSYVGNGKCGADNPIRLTFTKKPMVVFVFTNTSVMTLIQGMSTSWASNSTSSSSSVSVTWSGNTVSWYGDQTYSQLSSNNQTYRVLALLQAG